jgi:hypothetical protein
MAEVAVSRQMAEVAVSRQMAEVAVSRQMFQEILSLIAGLRAPPAPA